MDNKVKTVLENRNPNIYTAAFFGASFTDTAETLEKGMKVFKSVGINTLVYQYQGEKNGKDAALSDGIKNGDFDKHWYELQQEIIPVFKKLNMKFVFQDAAPFPSGSCNGWFAFDKYRAKRKLCLKQHKLDISGPVKNATFFIKEFEGAGRLTEMALARLRGIDPGKEEKLKYVVAVKRVGLSNRYDFQTAINLTDKVEKGLLNWDVPEGRWSIFVYVDSYNVERKNYMNLLDKDSCRLMIDSIYAPHVEALKDEIGKTWLGFFYDEPEVGNDKDFYFSSIVGKKEMPLPWCDELEDRMAAVMGENWVCQLPRLWMCAREHEQYHYEYLNIVTDLIRKNYNGQLYAFCKEHGLLYFGHVIEDDNCDTRLGLGTGHYFRMQEYQDISGIDLICHQHAPGLDIPGVANGSRAFGDGQFYHYGIMRMCSSLAHLDCKKNNRAFSETLAVYGSVVGPKYRKYMADTLNVNGVNHCIYVTGGTIAGGVEQYFPHENSIYGHYFKNVSDYHNKLSFLLSGKQHLPTAAVLYHAENEWSNSEQAEYSHDISAVLSRNQIDFDLVSVDMLAENGSYALSFKNGCFVINNVEFPVLIIPRARRVPIELMEFVNRAKKYNVDIVYIDQKPSDVSNLKYNKAVFNEFTSDDYGTTLSLGELMVWMHSKGYYAVKADHYEPFLRCFMIKDDENTYFFFHNGNTYADIHCEIELPCKKAENLYELDIMANRLTRLKVTEKDGRLTMPVDLGQWGTKLVIDAEENLDEFVTSEEAISVREITGSWKIHMEPYYSFSGVPSDFETGRLEDIAKKSENLEFSGQVTYETEVDLTEMAADRYTVDISEVYECVEILVNGVYCGSAVSYPYCVDVTRALKVGRNDLTIQVCTNVARGIPDPYKANRISYAEPIGITGKVALIGWRRS